MAAEGPLVTNEDDAEVPDPASHKASPCGVLETMLSGSLWRSACVAVVLTGVVLSSACGRTAREAGVVADTTTTAQSPTSTDSQPSVVATTVVAAKPRETIGDCGDFGARRGRKQPPDGVTVSTQAEGGGLGEAVTFHVTATNNTDQPVQYIGGGNPHEVDVLLGDRFVFVPSYGLGRVKGGRVLYLQPGESQVLTVEWNRETCDPNYPGDDSARYIPNSAPSGTYRVAAVWHSWEAPEITITLR